jgi:hypothetical protein
MIFATAILSPWWPSEDNRRPSIKPRALPVKVEGISVIMIPGKSFAPGLYNANMLSLPWTACHGFAGKWKMDQLLVGMRAGTSTYVLLQMNHSEYARYSLSTVLRSYFFEHEIALGQEEIKFVNGTCAAFQRCCESDRCVTVTARRGLAAFVLCNWIAPWHSAPDHALNMKRWTT